VRRITVDVLLVSPGTTAGWRRLDAHATKTLNDLGLSVAIAKSEFRLARHLRRTMQLTDLAEAGAMRLAVSRALSIYDPRAILFSGVQSTLLQPRARLQRAGLRYDALTVDNRPGRANAVQHSLERRALRHLRLLLPAARASTVPPGLAPEQHVLRLPFPVAFPETVIEDRDPVVLCYAGNPDKKGLDLIVAAWAEAHTGERRLAITGIDPDEGRAFLRARKVPEPPGLEWVGILDPEPHAELLGRAEAYVSASRYEDYGMAQLEALACGTPLVTSPSDGPYEALAVARELEPALVARDSSPAALASALRAALEMPVETRSAYRRRARELVTSCAEEEVSRRIARDVLPLLELA
jgi:glycosyltransferase involved in cell wall biosynthesis